MRRMVATYTAHKLTPAQCCVLASFVAEAINSKVAHRHGVAAQALHRKGLIVQHHTSADRDTPCCTITPAGIDALDGARAEGW